MNRVRVLGALASRRQMDWSLARQQAGGTPALPGGRNDGDGKVTALAACTVRFHV